MEKAEPPRHSARTFKPVNGIGTTKTRRREAAFGRNQIVLVLVLVLVLDPEVFFEDEDENENE
jgi:hypothetical protein